MAKTEKVGKLSPEMEQLIEENKALKETNQILSDLVDNYDKALTDMTALQRESTDRLNEATEIIKNIVPTENGQIDKI
jgi:uncharacterized membrane protein YdfJ with MMPL/SSD domain